MSEATTRAAAYDLIDRFLRNNLYDDDYAKYSEALDAISQPAPSPQAPGRRKGPPGITLEPQGHEPPAGPVVSDEQIRATVESIQDHDTVPAFHNGYYTLTPDELRRAILALRPAVEPMTPEQRGIMRMFVSKLCAFQGKDEIINTTINEVEAHHFGITAKAKGGE